MKPKNGTIENNPYASPKVEEEVPSNVGSGYRGKVYNTLSIAIATIFGSVLAAGLLIHSNYSHFQQKSFALIAAGVTGVFTLAFMFFMLVIDFPVAMLFLATNFLIAAFLLPLNQILQGKQLELHEQNEREFHSYIRASLVGVSCAVAMLAMLLIASTMYVMIL